MSTSAGKGSKPRPFSVDHQTYASNWERVFGTKQPTDEEAQDALDRIERQEEVKEIVDSFENP